MAIDAALAERLDDALTADLAENGRLGQPKAYLDGDHDLPYMPKGAKDEYKHLAQRSITNWLPLFPDTFAKGLAVSGYRPAKSADNAGPWDFWQANGLDARQSIVYRGALNYGTSYALVLPGTVGTKRVPYFRPLDALRSAAWYQDVDDEFPEIALQRMGQTIDGTRLLRMFDRENVYTFARPKDGPSWRLSKTEQHGLGVTPFVRFRERLDGESLGIIKPLIPLQNRINEVVFSTLIALQYASFRQRWATGLAIPEDDNGQAVEPFKAAVDRLWVAEDATVKFGDFAQTETSGHAQQYNSAVSTMAAIGQINPSILTGSFDNVSADALAALQSTTQDKIGEYKVLFGEAWESGFRLAARAAGDTAAAADTSAQVRWSDTSVRTIAQTVDALGKLATMLEVPVEELWEMIPDVSETDVQRWKAARQSNPLADLASAIRDKSTTAAATIDAGTPAEVAAQQTAQQAA
jgi:hypothetical protein